MSLPQGQVNFVKCPSYLRSVGWGKERAFDLVVKIQLHWMTVYTDVNVPTPSKDAIILYPQLGEVGHIIDSHISCTTGQYHDIALATGQCRIYCPHSSLI